MYLPATPIPPVDLRNPDYDPFAKFPPPRASRAAIVHRPGRVDLPDVLRHPRDGRQQIQNEMPEMRAKIEAKRHDII